MSQCYGAHGDIDKCSCNSVGMFLRHHNMYINRHSGDQRCPTHLDMSGHMGGQIHCRPGREEERFLELYATSVKYQQPLFLIEHRTSVFPMFFDIDEKRYDVVEWSKVDRIEYVNTIQRSTRRFFPDVEDEAAAELFECNVCAPDKEVQHFYNEAGEEVSVKIGIHLHFANLLVNDANAKLIRAAAVAALEKDFPFNRKVLPEGWDGVIDSSVYDSNGLRMLKSFKQISCPDKCGSSKRKNTGCITCNGTGKVPQRRGYTPKWVIRGDNGEVDEEETRRVREDFCYALSRVSIRTRGGDAVADARFRRFKGCPSFKVDVVEGRCGGGGAPRRRVHKNDETGAKEIGISKRKQALELTPSRRKALQQIFHRINPVYKDIEIQDAVWLGNGRVPQLCVRVEGQGSSWCSNKGADHGNNTIYFMVTPEGARQRCFSHKEHCGVACHQYQGPIQPLVHPEGIILFESAGKKGSVADSFYGSSAPARTPASIAEARWDTSHDCKELDRVMYTGWAQHSVADSKPFVCAPGNNKKKKRKRACITHDDFYNVS